MGPSFLLFTAAEKRRYKKIVSHCYNDDTIHVVMYQKLLLKEIKIFNYVYRSVKFLTTVMVHA